MNKKLPLLILSLICFAAVAMSQETVPVKWRTTVKMTSPTEGTLTVRAVVTPGWHLYGTSLPKGGPVATTFDFTASKGIAFTGNFKPSVAPGQHADPMFGLTLSWWDKNVTFTRTFKLTGKIQDAVISGSIRYMACDGNTCRPPKTETVRATIPAYKPAK